MKNQNQTKEIKDIDLQNNSNNIMQELKQTNMITCTVHEKIAGLIQTENINEDQDRVLMCYHCIKEKQNPRFDQDNCILIDDIFQKGENNILSQWPPMTDSNIFEQLRICHQQQQNAVPIQQQIELFYKEFKDEIINKIDNSQKIMMSHPLIEEINNYKIIHEYQKQSQIIQIYQQLKGDKVASINDMEKNLVNIIKQFQDKNANTQKFQYILNKYKNQQNMINLQLPQLIKQSILSSIDKISFFQNYQKNNDINNNSEMNQELIQNRIYEQDKIETIMTLISNKSNQCSEIFLNKINDKLKQVNHLFDDVEFKNMFELDNQTINISAQTLNEMIPLIEKVEDLKYNNLYQNSHSINVYKQIQQYLNNYDSKVIKELFMKYPIFDLTEKYQEKQVINEFSFISTNKNDGQDRTEIIKENNQQKVSVISGNEWINCVSEMNLENDKKYIIKLQVKQLLKENNEQSQFMVGLIIDNEINNKLGYHDGLSCHFIIDGNTIYRYGQQGIDQQLNKGIFCIDHDKQIEIRISISEQILQIYDQSEKKSHIVLNDKNKDILKNNLNQQYKFYLGLQSNNISIILKDIRIVNFFKDN